jgi:hypothetical protein
MTLIQHARGIHTVGATGRAGLALLIAVANGVTARIEDEETRRPGNQRRR